MTNEQQPPDPGVDPMETDGGTGSDARRESHVARPAWSSPQSPPPGSFGAPASASRAPAPPPTAFVLRGPPRIFVTHVFLALNIAWFVWMTVRGVSLTSPQTSDLLRFGADFGGNVASGQWWRMLSAAFVHIGIIHIAANMWSLWRLGPLTERLYGNGAFTILYLLSAIGCSVASLLHAPAVVSAGASGAVFGIAGGALIYFLLHKRDMPSATFQVLVKNLGSVVVLNLILGFSIPGIDNAGHIGGLLTGLAAGWCLDRDPRVDPRLTTKRVGAVAFLALMVLGVCAFVPRRVRNSPEGWMMRAEEANDQGRWDEVEQATTEALRLSPKTQPGGARALLLHANALLQQGRTREALADCDRALALEPASIPTRRARAIVEMELGEFESAKADYTALVEQDPGHAETHLEFGYLLLALQDWPAAARSFEAAGKLAPDATEDADPSVASQAAVGQWFARVELGLIEQADVVLQKFQAGAPASTASPEHADLVRIALGKDGETAEKHDDPAPRDEWTLLLRAERAYALRDRDPKALERALSTLAELPPVPKETVARALAGPFLKRTRDEFARRLRR